MSHPAPHPGTPTPPPGPSRALPSQQRIENYWAQNGVQRLTPRQLRRGIKKARRESVRYLAAHGFTARVWK